MNYEDAASRYLGIRQEIDVLEKAHKANKAGLREKMLTLENWFTVKSQEDGLDSIKTGSGTAYWSTHHSATVASREELFNYCRDNNAWDLIESRASKIAVKSHVEATGEIPPGVNFSSVSVFNFRKTQ